MTAVNPVRPFLQPTHRLRGKGTEHLGEVVVHLIRRTLKKTPASTDEHRISWQPQRRMRVYLLIRTFESETLKSDLRSHTCEHSRIVGALILPNVEAHVS